MSDDVTPVEAAGSPDPGQEMFPGLFGEVTAEDVYGLRDYAAWRCNRGLADPDVVLDIGANIGIFTRFARTIFPKALIVAVEPDDSNYARLVDFTTDRENIVFQKAAIGKGAAWRATGAANGAHETYLTEGPGFATGCFEKDPGYEMSDVRTVSFANLVAEFVKPGQDYIVKLDCEGAETNLLADPESFVAIQGADYVAMEMHRTALHGGAPLAEVDAVVRGALKAMEETHDCWSEHVMRYARKKGPKDVQDHD